MPRMLARAGILVALFTPAFALAANDVSLTTDVVLSVNGITLNVSGSTAAVESIVVTSTNFTVTLPSGATFQITAPGLEKFTASTLVGVVKDICSPTESTLGYALVNNSVTVTITPSTALCSTSSGGGGGSSSNSGGGSTTSTTPATPATPAAAVATSTAPTVATTPATPATPAMPASGLSAPQIQAILDILASFDADAATIATVRASLEGTASMRGSVTSVAVRVFKSNLKVGSLGSEVKALQEFLNEHGFLVTASGAGSPGNETTYFGQATKAALIKYQKAKGITPAAGYFGAKTRAAVEAEL